MAEDVDGGNLLLGRGKIYFDRFTTAGVATGERFVGNATRLELGTTDDPLEKYSSADQSSGLMKSVNRKRTIECSMTLDEFTKENLALALMGTETVAAVTGAAVTNEVIGPVTQGCYYSLGGTARRRGLTLVTVEPNGGGTAFVLNTDYKIDAVSGRIYIVPGGGIANASSPQVDYTYASDTASVIIKGGVASLIEGFLRFIPDPAAGPKWELEIFHVGLNPDGVVGLISDDYGNFPIKAKVFSDIVRSGDATNPYYRLIKRT